MTLKASIQPGLRKMTVFTAIVLAIERYLADS